MEFVTFHVSLDKGEAAHPNQTLHHREYLSMIDMMFASARLFHKDVRTVVLTDEQTQFDKHHCIDALVRRPVDGLRLMYERTLAQYMHVQSSKFSRPMVILDSDILMNDSLDPLLDIDFDVALTWRDSPDQPINGGLMVLNNRRPEVVKAFFKRFIDVFREKYAQEHATWFGDQMALRDSVGLPPKDFAKTNMVNVQGCRILLLPCDTHNFSPSNRWTEVQKPLDGKYVLHFKGERKRLMAPYWRAWLRAKKSASPLDWSIAWVERWRLRKLVREEAVLPRKGQKTEEPSL